METFWKQKLSPSNNLILAKVMWTLARIKGLELLTIGFVKVTHDYVTRQISGEVTLLI
jgi:hypothetical protein